MHSYIEAFANLKLRGNAHRFIFNSVINNFQKYKIKLEESKMYLYALMFPISVLGCVYAAFNYTKVKVLDEGTDQMIEIAAAIREGSNTFLREEYKVIIKVVVIVTLILGIFIESSAAVSFMIGMCMSGLAGYVGMQASTYANVRVTNIARKHNNLGKTLKVALRGGSVMGLCVSAFALIGIQIVFLLFSNQLDNMGTITNWCRISFEPFSMTLSSYSLGCSIIAMFNRVGGGIFTKAADIGSDLAGKTEEMIPEDDPRNPGVIADCVGDNVGDTAGLGSDLLESYVGSIVSSIVYIIFQYNRCALLGQNFSEALFRKLYMYPLFVSALGLLSCIVGLIYILCKKDGDDPHKELNTSTRLSAVLTGISCIVLARIMFKGEDFGDLPLWHGGVALVISTFLGIASGIIVGMIAEYYTSSDYKPTQSVANAAKEGAALNIIQGLSVGMKSTLLTMITIGASMMFSYFVAGIFGITIAAVGMLSFVSMTVSVDTYGPISDNAGGIAEMCKLEGNVRKITDRLDAEGNTKAAMGKGFAIGSATYTAIGMMVSFICIYSLLEAEITLNELNILTLVGTLIGIAIPFYFSGLLLDAVSISARKMVDEIRRQFREIFGLREGYAKPDYKTCIAISTQGALAEMKKPAYISIIVPLICGFTFGPEFVAGFLFGAILTSIVLAILFGNSGGTWDNAKKYVEANSLKGLAVHIAAVIGDTVGDPLKDTAGPSLDILIKIMCTVSLVMVPIYSQYNLLAFIKYLMNVL